MSEYTSSVKNDPYRLKLHLMPPQGWLNDPNGLCQYDGIYHVFFQYVPEDAKGNGKKCWGHYTSADLLTWKFEGTFLKPDQEFDRDGVYSGCAWTDEEGIHLFYTGNVKEAGDYDYIHSGRKASQVLVTTKDGLTAGDKKMVLTNSDYPEFCTCHVRDPKVWKEGGRYYMALGARTEEDRGTVLIYESADLTAWKYFGEIGSQAPFGYMWECPDYFQIGGAHFLSISPQGLARGEFENQNVYQSGYFKLKNVIEILGNSKTGADGGMDYDRKENGARIEADEAAFTEWDKGFDFYAPQTFTDERGRRILIGWMGLPDIEKEYINPTVKSGWQHALTLPREITYENGRLYQQPVEELKHLRKAEKTIDSGEFFVPEEGIYEMIIDEIKADRCCVHFGGDLILDYRDRVFSMKFLNDTGAGRTLRRAKVERLEDIRIIMDTSAVEVYVNHGSTVFTSRYYPKNERAAVRVECEKSRNTIWELS